MTYPLFAIIICQKFLGVEPNSERMTVDGTMIFRKSASQNPLKIAVVGCGGMGCNALRSIDLPPNVKKIAIASDRRKISNTGAKEEMIISSKDAQSSALAKDSHYADNDAESQLSYLLKGYDLVFPIAGLGGNNGGWLASLVCRSARISKATPLALITTPLNAEGIQKRHTSTHQLEALRKWGSAVVFKNDQILKEVPNLPLMEAFKVMNKVVATPIREFTDLDRGCLKELKKTFKISHIFRMDIAEWRGDDPIFVINEELQKSDWLSLNVLDPKCAIFLAKGFGINEAWATEFTERFASLCDHGHDIPTIAFIDDSVAMKEIRVTAIIGL